MTQMDLTTFSSHFFCLYFFKPFGTSRKRFDLWQALFVNFAAAWNFYINTIPFFRCRKDTYSEEKIKHRINKMVLFYRKSN